MKMIIEGDRELTKAIEVGDYLYIRHQLKPYIKIAYKSQLVAYIMQNQRDENTQKLLIESI